MKNICIRLLLGWSLFFALMGTSFANAVPEPPIHSFNALEHFIDQELLQHQHIAPQHILLVMDLDNTLLSVHQDGCEATHSCHYLGGVAWYEWQRALSDHDPYRIANDTPHLLRKQARLFRHINLYFTDPGVPTTLHHLQQEGVQLMIETARGGHDPARLNDDLNMAPVTEATLKRHHLNVDSQHPHLRKPFPAGTPLKLLCPAQKPTTNRPVTFQHGILYVAGQDKGKLLLCLLHLSKSAGKQYDAIIFLDDKADNVSDVNAAFQQNWQAPVYTFRLNRLDQATQRFLHSTALQKHADLAYRQKTSIQAH